MTDKISSLEIEKVISNSSKEKEKSKLDTIKTYGGIGIWIIGIVFGAGALYTKVSTMEVSTAEQDSAIESIEDNQLKSRMSIERMEASGKEFNEKIFNELTKINGRISDIDERSLRNEIKIENLEEDVREIKGGK